MPKPFCVFGRIKGTLLVDEYNVYPLLNSTQYPPYCFGYWLIQKDKDYFFILNVLLV